MNVTRVWCMSVSLLHCLLRVIVDGPLQEQYDDNIRFPPFFCGNLISEHWPFTVTPISYIIYCF